MADYFLVEIARGPAWDHSRRRREQAGWDGHVAFMDGLTEEGVVVLGGPVGDGEKVLLVLLAPWLVDDVQHVGSTAVPGLPAKPIVDLMAGVGSLEDAPEIARVLAPHDWRFVPPELDARPWERFFVKVAADRRVAHLHLLDPASPRWAERLRFRG